MMVHKIPSCAFRARPENSQILFRWMSMATPLPYNIFDLSLFTAKAPPFPSMHRPAGKRQTHRQKFLEGRGAGSEKQIPKRIRAPQRVGGDPGGTAAPSKIHLFHSRKHRPRAAYIARRRGSLGGHQRGFGLRGRRERDHRHRIRFVDGNRLTKERSWQRRNLSTSVRNAAR